MTDMDLSEYAPADIEKLIEYLSQERRSALSRLIKRAMARGKEQGMWMHRAPYGYRIVRMAGSPYLEQDPEVFPFLVEAQALKESGLKPSAIIEKMTLKGMLGAGGLPFTAGGLRAVLKRPLLTASAGRNDALQKAG